MNKCVVMNFPKNDGFSDRIVRIILGVIFLILALDVFVGFWQIVLLILSAMMFITALTGFCAIYKIFNFSTKKD